MNINGVKSFRHRESSSSDRFFDMFTPPKIHQVSGDFSDELTESDVFWNSSDSTRQSDSPSSRRKLGFRLPGNSGVLSALPDDGRHRPATPSRAIPKPQREYSQRAAAELTQSAPGRKFQSSAPVNVPAMKTNFRKYGDGMEEFLADESDEEMLPPHEIVDWKRKKMNSSSVLEGVGRTLKGRDLRTVRNAVWRQTGFCD